VASSVIAAALNLRLYSRWSVSHSGETFAICLIEEEAFSATFARASERRRVGINVVVVVTHGLKTPEA